MEEVEERNKGWKPIPLPLKVLTALFAFWILGSVLNLSNLFENGMPFFGVFVYGATAIVLPILLDIVGPMVFLFALWNRKPWGPKWAFSYIGMFILNGLVALFAVREDLGLAQLLVPTIVSIVFVVVIYWKRNYFEHTPSLDSASG